LGKTMIDRIRRYRSAVMWGIAIVAGCFFGYILAMHLTGQYS
jgi:hypothetical protein